LLDSISLTTFNWRNWKCYYFNVLLQIFAQHLPYDWSVSWWHISVTG